MFIITSWNPPNLSLSERVSLGREVSKVGKKAFLQALTKRTNFTFITEYKTFFMSDVIKDAKYLRETNFKRPPIVWGMLPIPLLFFAGCILVIASHSEAIILLVVGMVPTLASVYFTQQSKNSWDQTLIEDYAYSVASRN